MKCVKCQIDLPDAAKFCPACGSKQEASAKTMLATPAVLSEVSRPAPAPAPAAPAPVAPAAPAPVAPAPAATAPPVSAASTDSEPKNDPASMRFSAEDLKRAMVFACKRGHKNAPAQSILDLEAYYKVGQQLGIERSHMEASLHSVALEKMQGVTLGETGRGAAGEVFRVHTVDSIPLPDLTTKKEKFKAGVFAIYAGIALVVGIVLLLSYQAWLDDKAERLERRAAVEKAKAAENRPPPQGRIDEIAVRDSIVQVVAKVKECCNAELKEKLTEPVTYKVQMLVGMDGKATNINVMDDPLKSAEVTGCIQKEVAAFTFPKPEGAPADIGIPLTFEPAANSKKRGK